MIVCPRGSCICHASMGGTGLNPWVVACPTCGCPNEDYREELTDEERVFRDSLLDFMRNGL